MGLVPEDLGENPQICLFIMTFPINDQHRGSIHHFHTHTHTTGFFYATCLLELNLKMYVAVFPTRLMLIMPWSH